MTRRSRKRAKGEGTIVQLKDGRYEAKVFIPTTAGTVKRLSVYGRTREERHAKYVKLKAQADDGIPVASESWTVERYLSYWLEHVVRVERRPKTYQGYEGVVRRYLIPELGKKRLGTLNARDVRLFITRIREACQCCRNGWDHPATNRAVAPSQSPNAAPRGYRSAWSSPCTPSYETHSRPLYGRKSCPATSPNSSKSARRNTRSTAA